MNQIPKNFGATLILASILALSFTQMTKAYSSEANAPDEVLIFLEDVVKLDLSKYDVELLGTTVNHPPELGGFTQISGKYALQSRTSKLTVLFNFKNGSLSWCLIRVIEGSPHYSIQMSTNIRDSIKDLLQRYQSYTGDSELETMKNMLNAVDATKNTTKTIGIMKISISNTADATSFDWKYTVNSADYMGIMISLRNGSLYSFSDTRNLYTIGSTSVNISKEEAIVLSYMYAENLTWTIGNTEVTDFNIVEEGTDPELLTRSRDEPLKLYPYWYVLLYLDDIYPGNIRHVQVMFWADTGELISCQPLNLGGGPPPGLVSIEAQSSLEQSASLLTQQIVDVSLSTHTLIIVFTIASIVAIAIIAILLKKHK